MMMIMMLTAAVMLYHLIDKIRKKTEEKED